MDPSDPSLPFRLADRAAGMHGSEIRDLLVLLDRPEVISFAGGIPDPALFPVEAVAAAAEDVLRRTADRALQYGPTQGDAALRLWIAERMRSRGVDGCTPENVLITAGSQQALDLIARLLVGAGDTVAAEDPSYLGALQVFRTWQAAFRPLSGPGGGVDPDRLAPPGAPPPALAYLVPDFANPTGGTLEAETRTALVEAAARARTAIVEDAAYTDLRYNGEAEPSILAIDAQLSGGIDRSRTLHCGSFSKILVPGLRVGWICAARPVIDRLVQAKQAADLHTATLNQRIVGELATTMLDDHVPRLIETYRARRDAMLSALGRHFGNRASWSSPRGGMFVWLALPEALDTTALLPTAVAEHDVAYVPGGAFRLARAPRRDLRLSFTLGSEERIDEGIRRLAALLTDPAATEPAMAG